MNAVVEHCQVPQTTVGKKVSKEWSPSDKSSKHEDNEQAPLDRQQGLTNPHHQGRPEPPSDTFALRLSGPFSRFSVNGHT